MPKGTRLRVAIALIIIVVIAVVVTLLVVNRSNPANLITVLKLGSGTSAEAVYKLEKVTTPQDQAEGLSGRTGLAPRTGMLFDYNQTTQRCMWMKDMKFNIDIVWFDENGRISSIVNDLSPATYPQSYCADGRTVVELPTGTAKTYGLRVGQIVKF